VRFTRRHARALAAGAATTAAYLAGPKLTGSRAIRGTSLLLLAVTATVGAAQASAVAKTTKKRLDQHIADTADAVHFINHGGTISGPITCGSLSASSVATGGGSINTSGGTLSCGGITCGTISMGGTLTMNLHDAFTFGHITSNQIGPGGDRALLGAGATLAQVQARCDFLLQQLEGANICY
jgi:hypothetical protein